MFAGDDLVVVNGNADEVECCDNLARGEQIGATWPEVTRRMIMADQDAARIERKRRPGNVAQRNFGIELAARKFRCRNVMASRRPENYVQLLIVGIVSHGSTIARAELTIEAGCYRNERAFIRFG